MAVWLVRAGQNGESEDVALDKGLVVIDYDEVPDLTSFSSREALEVECRRIYPDQKPRAYSVHVRQLWDVRDRIRQGDLVILPLKTRGAIAIGVVIGAYWYNPDLPKMAHHARPVRWIRTDVPRATFSQDLRRSLGAKMTVCQIQRNDAEQRSAAILRGQPDPGM